MLKNKLSNKLLSREYSLKSLTSTQRTVPKSKYSHSQSKPIAHLLKERNQLKSSICKQKNTNQNIRRQTLTLTRNY